MAPIVIPFTVNNLGRVDFSADVMTENGKSFKKIEFKLDSGSDFTTLDCDDLYNLGYSQEFLAKCPFHHTGASTASDNIKLQYIKNVSIKFEDREIQGCRIFFALGTGLRSLFGSDMLKYFNWEVSYDKGLLQLAKVEKEPLLSEGETVLQIYSVEQK